MATPKNTATKPKAGQPPTETLVLQWLLEPETVNVSTTTASMTAVEGSTLQIGDEYMVVTDASAPDRLVVKRGVFDTDAVEHPAGATVSVWGEPEDGGASGKHPIAKSELAGVGATIKRSQTMTDNAQQLNNKSASAQGAPPPYGNKEARGSLKSKAQPGRFGHDERKGEEGNEGQDDREFDTNLVNQHPQRITRPKEEPRGAGSGEEANATRGRTLVQWPGPTMSHEEHVDELLTIAQLNEDFNNEMNGRVYDRGERTLDLLANPRGNEADGEAQSTPDAYEAARLAFEDADPFRRAETIGGEMEARAARDRKQVEELYGEDALAGESATLSRTAAQARSTITTDAPMRRENDQAARQQQ